MRKHLCGNCGFLSTDWAAFERHEVEKHQFPTAGPLPKLGKWQKWGKWVWTAVTVVAVGGALWWLIDPRPDFYITRVYIALCLLWFGVERLAEEHRL